MDLSGQTGLAPESATPCRPNRRDSGFGNGACGAAYVAQLCIKVRRRKNYFDNGV